VGSNRQTGGNKGEISWRYPLMSSTKATFINFFSSALQAAIGFCEGSIFSVSFNLAG
jgi:hypothetical protein